MKAHFPRAYLDVNREPYELDPALFVGRLPDYANTHTMRVIGGLGVIARVVNEQEEIYRGPLSLAAALERIERLHKPYHEALSALVAETLSRFGCACLIDCHSMPSQANERGGRTPDFVLGDRFGRSCSPAILRLADAALTRLGYRVEHNKPYAGGYITEHYGRPSAGIHALQVEVNRALYVDEGSFVKLPAFEGLAADISRFAAAMIAGLPGALGRGEIGAAAE